MLSMWFIVLIAILIIAAFVFKSSKSQNPPSQPVRTTKKIKAPTHKKTQTNYSYSTDIIELDITYQDAKGEITNRHISIIKYDPSKKKIYARCHLRKSMRSFYIDRILTAIDIETGEILSDLDGYISERINY